MSFVLSGYLLIFYLNLFEYFYFIRFMDLTKLVAMSFILSGYLLIFYLNLFEYFFPLISDLLFKIIFCEEVTEFFEHVTNIGSLSLFISFLLIIIILPFLFL